MISIHESFEANQTGQGWLQPFENDPDYWLPGQETPEEPRLDNIEWAMACYTWSPAYFKSGVRGIDNFLRAQCLGLDFDGTQTLAWGIETFKDHACVIGTTRNHQVLKDGRISDRFRVLLLLTEPIYDPEIYKATAQHLIRRYKSDPQCCDCSRIFYNSKTIEYVGPEKGDRILPAPKPKPVVYDPRPHVNSRGEFLTRAIRAFREFGIQAGYRNTHLYQAACDYFKLAHKNFDWVYGEMRPRTDLPESEFLATLHQASKKKV